jgi:hypothetical protein
LYLHSAHGVDEIQPRKIALIISNNRAAMTFRYRRNDHIKGAAWAALRRTFGHQSRPEESGIVVKRENSPRKQALRAFGTFEPAFKITPTFARRQFQYPAPDLCHG